MFDRIPLSIVAVVLAVLKYPQGDTVIYVVGRRAWVRVEVSSLQ